MQPVMLMLIGTPVQRFSSSSLVELLVCSALVGQEGQGRRFWKLEGISLGPSSASRIFSPNRQSQEETATSHLDEQATPASNSSKFNDESASSFSHLYGQIVCRPSKRPDPVSCSNLKSCSAKQAGPAWLGEQSIQRPSLSLIVPSSHRQPNYFFLPSTKSIK